MATLIDLGEYVQKGNPNGMAFNGDANGATPLRRHDPAQAVPGAAPNFGQFAFPHVLSFAGTSAGFSRVYRASDEALRDSWANARAMRNDLVVMECVEARQRAASLLNWHVEPPDGKDGSQKQVADTLTKIISSIPRFMQYRENLLHATFYGRYAVAHRWRWKNVAGGRRIVVDRWRPVHGDKLVWRYEPDDPQWDDDQVGIRVGYGYTANGTIGGRWTVEKIQQVHPTDLGLAYFLRPWERPLLSIHKHSIEDGEFESPEYAGRIHGVGIRSRIYWTWYQKQETLAWLMEYLERSAGGFEIWFYPWGNEQARLAVEKSARERMSLGRNQLLVPKFMENDSFGQWYDRIEPGMAGADALKSIIVEYFGHLLKRYILGQTLTTESAGTGLGSNLADVHLATFLQIVKYDTTNLEETLTTDLLDPIIRYNFPWATGMPFKFRIDTESENSHQKLEAFEKAWSMGLKLRAQDVFDIIGATKPGPDDEVLDNSTQANAAGMGGMGGLASLLGGQAAGAAASPPDDDAPAEPMSEQFSATWREADHPRSDEGKFAAKGQGGGEAINPPSLPGLPKGPERKLDLTKPLGSTAAALASADERGDAQYRSLAGQRSLFEGEDASVDASRIAALEEAAQRKAINPTQAELAAKWVQQHGKQPEWFTLAGNSLFDDSGASLVGRIDRGKESYAVHFTPDGEVSVYHWPGFGKSKKLKFAGALRPMQATHAATAKPKGMLFSRALQGV